jgi:hypothetical protein
LQFFRLVATFRRNLAAFLWIAFASSSSSFGARGADSKSGRADALEFCVNTKREILVIRNFA